MKVGQIYRAMAMFLFLSLIVQIGTASAYQADPWTQIYQLTDYSNYSHTDNQKLPEDAQPPVQNTIVKASLYYEEEIGTEVEEDTLQEDAEDIQEALIYEVIKGDTLYRIAAHFDSTVTELQLYNNLLDPDKIYIGQKIAIPAANQLQISLPLVEGKQPVIEKVLNSTLTAYTAGKESTGKSPGHPAYGITFSGVKAEEGRTVAVDPAVIPLGTKVYIEGIGIRTAEDTGSAIKGAKIDVFMNDLTEARIFGVKHNVKVFVLSDT